MEMQNQTNQADIKDLNFSELLFRQIDRIMSLSQKTYASNEDKLFDYLWSVKLLRSLIPEELRIQDEEFSKKEAIFNTTRKELLANKQTHYSDHFDNVETLFELCIDLLAKKGLLYRRTSNGSTSY